jgi:hypothetical protein
MQLVALAAPPPPAGIGALLAEALVRARQRLPQFPLRPYTDRELLFS